MQGGVGAGNAVACTRQAPKRLLAGKLVLEDAAELNSFDVQDNRRCAGVSA